MPRKQEDKKSKLTESEKEALRQDAAAQRSERNFMVDLLIEINTHLKDDTDIRNTPIPDTIQGFLDQIIKK